MDAANIALELKNLGDGQSKTPNFHARPTLGRFLELSDKGARRPSPRYRVMNSAYRPLRAPNSA